MLIKMAGKKNVVTITNAGEDVKKLSHSYISGGYVKMVWPLWKNKLTVVLMKHAMTI